MDRSEIENTDDWFGCPTPLETCRQQLLMYENEIQELTLRLRQERERIFKLVKILTQTTKERDAFRDRLSIVVADLSKAKRMATDIETKNTWEMMANRKEISHLYERLRAATGKDPRTGLPVN